MTKPSRTTEPEAAVHAFDRWAANWSGHYREDGTMAPRIRRFAEALSSRVEAGSAVLDFGCGTGEITRALAANGWRMAGCDLSSAMLERAAEADADGTVDWRRLVPEDLPALPYADASYDAVIASSVFEYIVDPAGQMREIARILRPGGWFLLTVPDSRHRIRRMEAAIAVLARPMAIRVMARHTRWREVFDYLRLSVNRWPAGRWFDLLQEAGFDAVDPGACTHPLMLIAAVKRVATEP